MLTDDELTVESAIEELKKYSGYPRCMDCKWKLNTDITNNCACFTKMTPEKEKLNESAFNYARKLQRFLIEKGEYDRFLQETSQH